MTVRLSCKLALGNLRKNYRFYIPRILAETGLLACFYIVYTLACDERLASVKGGSYLPTFMWMAAVIVGLLSFILLLYTNSFLMKQRKREFGLYSVLGMEKKHICRVLFHELLICTVISVAAGLLCGMLFYKVCSLAICKLLKATIVAGFYYITPMTVMPAGAVFIGIDLVAYIVNCIGIGRMKPVELLAGTSTGEKEPKVKWTLFVLGILTLGSGYAISLTTDDPLKAIPLFFAAVLLVIVGTYFLFTAGSIFVLKALKKNERYYYRPDRMTAVSGLLYRMKQNAVGLASVAILATGVLVMISTTFCLYTRTEAMLKANYPRDCYLSAAFWDDQNHMVKIPEEVMAEIAQTAAEKSGLRIKETASMEYYEVAFIHQPGALISDLESVSDETDLPNLCDITFITEEMYCNLGGQALGLRENEVAVCPYTAAEFPEVSFTLFDKAYTVVKTLTSFPVNSRRTTVSGYGMVVADEAVFDEIFSAQEAAYGVYASERQCSYGVSFENRAKAFDNGDAFAKDVLKATEAYIESVGYTSYSIRGVDSVWEARDSLYGMYGTLLFLGILLGIVCLFATVLIIYYKQISEGYEDRQRYQIMRKIGMTDREVRKTIHSQITLVFFLPLATAGLHVLFAFPILTKMMRVLLLDNAWLFAKWCLIVYAAFALVYALIYKVTARTYYKIVY